MESWPTTRELLPRLYAAGQSTEAIEWDLPSFLELYTLHDSGLVEVRLDQWDGLLVLVDWDMHWNERVLPQYSNLVMAIPTVYSVVWSQGGWRQCTLDGATSQRVSPEERNRMLEDGSVDLRAYQGARDEIVPPFEDETLTRTVFQLMNWGRLTVVHAAKVKLLCLDDQGRAGQLPQGVG